MPMPQMNDRAFSSKHTLGNGTTKPQVFFLRRETKPSKATMHPMSMQGMGKYDLLFFPLEPTQAVEYDTLLLMPGVDG